MMEQVGIFIILIQTDMHEEDSSMQEWEEIVLTEIIFFMGMDSFLFLKRQKEKHQPFEKRHHWLITDWCRYTLTGIIIHYSVPARMDMVCKAVLLSNLYCQA